MEKAKIEMQRKLAAAQSSYNKTLIDVRSYDDFTQQFRRRLDNLRKDEEKAN